MAWHALAFTKVFESAFSSVFQYLAAAILPVCAWSDARSLANVSTTQAMSAAGKPIVLDQTT